MIVIYIHSDSLLNRLFEIICVHKNEECLCKLKLALLVFMLLSDFWYSWCCVWQYFAPAICLVLLYRPVCVRQNVYGLDMCASPPVVFKEREDFLRFLILKY